MRISWKTRKDGFTLTELLVVVGVGAVLLGLFAVDLAAVRARLLRQACAANLKQWGMAIDLYSQDHEGAYFYRSDPGLDWSDAGSPYTSYLGGGDSVGTMRNMRVCPVIAARFTQEQIVAGQAGFSYSMALPQAKFGGLSVYRNIDTLNSPWNFNNSILPTLRYLPNPSQFLLIMEGGGNLPCGTLVNKVSSVPSTGPPIKPIDRHGGGVNCLFGDFHVEFISAQTLSNQDAMGGCTTPAGNSWFNMN